MKTFNLLLLLILISQITVAQEVLESSQGDTLNIHEATAEAMICARDIIKYKLGGREGVHFAGVVISKLKTFRENGKEVANVRAHCLGEKVKMTPDTAISRDEQRLAAKDYFDPINPPFGFDANNVQVSQTLQKFIEPTSTCDTINISSALAPLIAVGFKSSGGYCRSTDGQRWVEAGFGAGVGSGIGLGLTFVSRETKEIIDPNGSIFSVRKSWSGGFGFILMLARDSEKYDSDDGAGFGVGLLAYVIRTVSLNAAIIPLSDDKEFLVSLL